MIHKSSKKIGLFVIALALLSTVILSPMTAYAAETTAQVTDIELDGTVTLAESTLPSMVPTIEKNEADVWMVTTTVGSKVIVGAVASPSRRTTPVLVLQDGVVSGRVTEEGQLEVTANEVGIGMVAFQYVNYRGIKIGKPCSIAIHVVEALNAEEYLDQYFTDSVFCGDSIILGLKNYAFRAKTSRFNKAQYLCAGSYSVRYAINANNPENLHPMYKGQKRVLPESIAMMQPKHVFLFFGLNDLNITGLQGCINNYKILADQILSANPNVDINVISMTWTLEGTGKGKLANSQIKEFNSMLEQTAAEQGWGYVDLASSMADANGNLKSAYCSDGFVHHSRSAYDQAWNDVLTAYALTRIGVND